MATAQEAESLCAEFAAITDTDSACGHMFLQESSWDLNAAVNMYFASQSSASTESAPKSSKRKLEIMEVDNTSDLKRQKDENSTDEASSSAAESDSGAFTFLTWNIDGLDDKNLRSRTAAVIECAVSEKPTVLFLQEVIAETLALISSQLGKFYHIVSGARSFSSQYFVVTLIRRSDLLLPFNDCTDSAVLHYSHTVMDRCLLRVSITLKNGLKVEAFNTHLESTAAHAETRAIQFRECIKHVESITDNDRLIILAGDLNMRDKDELTNELKAASLQDCWVLAGQPKEAKFTWDMMKNDNKTFEKFKPRCRFDRVYIRVPTILSTNPVKSFKLTGKTRLRSALCFPSDHFGIHIAFDAKTKG